MPEKKQGKQPNKQTENGFTYIPYSQRIDWEQNIDSKMRTRLSKSCFHKNTFCIHCYYMSVNNTILVFGLILFVLYEFIFKILAFPQDPRKRIFSLLRRVSNHRLPSCLVPTNQRNKYPDFRACAWGCPFQE
mmetsp:Transcript_3600/g.5312  ORF Transcript_3600/g.5312 Transcript_3600/m.5312 type:complete len:132 (-) Transcript_3600:866-1261(-)